MPSTSSAVWDDDIMPALQRYIAIPNVSVAYDADWEAHGHMDEAVQLVREWCAARPIDGLTVDVHRIPGRTPLILAEVPASTQRSPTDTVLLYGHLDKQPEMTGWRDGLGPWTPVIEGDRLYGRGGADDGYAAFAALLAIEVARRTALDHARCVVLIEASEESRQPRPSRPPRAPRRPSSAGPTSSSASTRGAADNERLWVTTSLRGLVGGTLTVEVLDRGRPLRRRPAASCRRPSGSSASSSTGSRTRPRARCCSPRRTSTSPPTASPRPTTTAD